MDESYISKRLTQLRMEKGVSARVMSIEIEQANNYITNIENQKALPSMKGLFLICEYFDISLKEFFDVENESPTLLNELIEELKRLNPKTLGHLLEITRELNKKHYNN